MCKKICFSISPKSCRNCDFNYKHYLLWLWVNDLFWTFRMFCNMLRKKVGILSSYLHLFLIPFIFQVVLSRAVRKCMKLIWKSWQMKQFLFLEEMNSVPFKELDSHVLMYYNKCLNAHICACLVASTQITNADKCSFVVIFLVGIVKKYCTDYCDVCKILC